LTTIREIDSIHSNLSTLSSSDNDINNEELIREKLINLAVEMIEAIEVAVWDISTNI
jgi:hypothetical protein